MQFTKKKKEAKLLLLKTTFLIMANKKTLFLLSFCIPHTCPTHAFTVAKQQHLEQRCVLRRSVPVFLRHKGAIELSRPAWAKRWPFPPDHTGSASTNTERARAARWQPVPWSGSSSLWLEARQQKLPVNLFHSSFPSRCSARGTWSSRRSQRQRHLWKREWCAALLKSAHVHTHGLKGQVFVGVGFCARCRPRLVKKKKKTKKKTAQDALTFLPNNRKALCFCSRLPFPLFV